MCLKYCLKCHKELLKTRFLPAPLFFLTKLFLTNLLFSVHCNNVLSNFYYIKADIPQGSGTVADLEFSLRVLKTFQKILPI